MSKKLVAYFSASGTTEKVAQMIADVAGADLYEITPKVRYTKADLNWMDKKARNTVEMNDKSIRPEMTDDDAHVENYDEIILGFPIWWYVAPNAEICEGKLLNRAGRQEIEDWVKTL